MMTPDSHDAGKRYGDFAGEKLAERKAPACPKYGPCEHCGGETDHEGECATCRDFGGTDKIVTGECSICRRPILDGKDHGHACE